MTFRLHDDDDPHVLVIGPETPHCRCGWTPRIIRWPERPTTGLREIMDQHRQHRMENEP